MRKRAFALVGKIELMKKKKSHNYLSVIDKYANTNGRNLVKTPLLLFFNVFVFFLTVSKPFNQRTYRLAKL